MPENNTNQCPVIYTDGACSGNPGWGGWAAVLTYRDRQMRLNGGEPETTNNRMELQAAIEGLKKLRRPVRVVIHTDSQYLRLGITTWIKSWIKNGWKTAGKKQVKNRDLWEQLVELSSTHDIEWLWVRGHDGNAGNELADQLAREGLERARSTGQRYCETTE